MKALLAIVAPSTTRLFYHLTAQAFGSAVISSFGGITFMSFGTTSLSYVPAFTAQFTVDKHGSITVSSIFLLIITNNDANAQCKLQVSGNGGSSFVDITGDIPSGVNLQTSGAGLWINSINIGTNQLQIRLMIKSTNGALANSKIRHDSTLRFMINKKFV